MSDIAIKVEGLSKLYRIGVRQHGNKMLRERLNDLALTPFRGLRSLVGRRGNHSPNGEGHNPQSATIWALRDVSFEVKRGEVLGIIGRNGAGKSTLLRVLSRITEPTSGEADIHGRVGSLLEVGTGFHSELTGRENIFLNGAILGMRRAEIERNFDEMVSFAEVEKFIDTPVKHYSTGMYMRLAFAVAAHLDPEVLIVDEVLAVGDAAFQKKCLTRMSGIARKGRTVLFVSHNMEAVRTLCTRCILLDRGRLVEDGPPAQIIEKTLELLRGPNSSGFFLALYRDAPSLPKPLTVEVHAADKSPEEMINFDDEIIVSIRLDRPMGEEHTFAFQIFTSGGLILLNTFYRDHPDNPPLQPGATISVSVRIPARFLPGGTYEAAFAYMRPNAETFWLTRDTWFEVQEISSYRNEGLSVKRPGLVAAILPWDAN
jgi:ABC-type polysaccharide/polyol phosphate transport system ATPase subunit